MPFDGGGLKLSFGKNLRDLRKRTKNQQPLIFEKRGVNEDFHMTKIIPQTVLKNSYGKKLHTSSIFEFSGRIIRTWYLRKIVNVFHGRSPCYVEVLHSIAQNCIPLPLISYHESAMMPFLSISQMKKADTHAI